MICMLILELEEASVLMTGWVDLATFLYEKSELHLDKIKDLYNFNFNCILFDCRLICGRE